VVAIPYVTALPPFLIDPATTQPVLIDGQVVPLIGPDGRLGPGDHVLLPASADLARGIGIPVAFGGSGQPLSDGVVLNAAETATIEARREEFNAIIRAVAGETGAALVDVAAIFDQVLQHGILLGGITLTTDFLTGGLFSYDGVHASPTGYAIIANAFIDAINTTYGGSIPTVPIDAFMLGGLGRLPGTLPGEGEPAAGSFIFSSQAERNLRRVLNVPKERKLIRIKTRRERRAGSVLASSAREGRPSPAERREVRRQRRDLRRALR
jgi:hypothetical protein